MSVDSRVNQCRLTALCMCSYSLCIFVDINVQLHFVYVKPLQDLKRESADARNLAVQYRNQASGLYQSSAAVIGKVNAALERAVVLGDEVRAVSTNGTQVLQDSQGVLTAARDAVSRANRVYGHAQRMLDVARNFQTESLRAQASANKSLLSVGWIQTTTQQIIEKVAKVNESSARTLSTAVKALRLGNMIHNLSVSEQQVCTLISLVFTSYKSRDKHFLHPKSLR